MESMITTLGLLFLFSVIGGLIASRFKQPVVLGLMLVGMIIGPHMLNIVSDTNVIDIMVEFGAILFLFIMGLEFSVKRLFKTGFQSLLVTTFKVGIMFFIAFAVTMLLGYGPTTAAFMGVALSFSSTMIIMNILKQKDMIARKEVPLVMAVLVIEDIFGVLALTFFAAMKEAGFLGVVKGMEQLFLSLLILVVVYILFVRYSERIVTWLTKQAGEDIIPFIALGLCAGFAYLASLLDLSPSAGAFMAGSIVSTFRESKLFEHSIKPHSLMFTSFFFIAIGTIINVHAVIENISLILLLAAIIILGLFIAMGLVSRVFSGFSPVQGTFSSLAMLPPGVFSLLVAKESVQNGVALDMVSIVSALVFILSIVMSLSLKHLAHINERIVPAKKNALEMGVERISQFFTQLFDELNMENAYSRKLKIRAGISFRWLLGALFVGAAAFKVAEFFPRSALFAYVMGAALCGYLMYRTSKSFSVTKMLLIKMMGASANKQFVGRVVKGVNLGILFTLLGLFSPLAIYVMNGPAYLLLMSVGGIIAGVYWFTKTAKLLTGRTTYKPVYEYRKMVLPSNTR